MEPDKEDKSMLKSIVVIFKDFAKSNKIDKSDFEKFCQDKSLKHNGVTSGVCKISDIDPNIDIFSLISELKQISCVLTADINQTRKLI